MKHIQRFGVALGVVAVMGSVTPIAAQETDSSPTFTIRSPGTSKASTKHPETDGKKEPTAKQDDARQDEVAQNPARLFPLTKEELERGVTLRQEASKLIIAQDVDQAIVKCKEALTLDAFGCYKLLGTAFKMKDDPAQSCTYFALALGVETGDVSRIKTQMLALKCEQLSN